MNTNSPIYKKYNDATKNVPVTIVPEGYDAARDGNAYTVTTDEDLIFYGDSSDTYLPRGSKFTVIMPSDSTDDDVREYIASKGLFYAADVTNTAKIEMLLEDWSE